MIALLFCFLALVHTQGITDFVSEEEKALLSLKSSLIDPLDLLKDWKPRVGGSSRGSHCYWTGVSCNSNGSVEKLDLSHMNLSGRVSDEIQSIKSLAFFNICCNAFSASLPKSLSNLKLLRNLDVSQNFFVGSFPAGLDKATGLITINASSNNFSGSLPEEIGNLTLLERLDFRGSFFQGEIPATYKNLKKLKFLGLSGNNLTGKIPPELGQLSSLERIIIGYNEFHGQIPAEFGNLTNLQYLDIAVANLDGGFPAELGMLTLLNTVFLFRNNLEGKIPPEIGNLSSLALLDVSDNLLYGDVPVELGHLKSLQLLNLMCNRFTDMVPAGIGELTKLEVLELWNNSFTGPLPRGLGRNSPLQWLDVSSNSFSGQIPAGLCNGANLMKLILFNNGFTGAIPSSLSNCSSLVRVRIQNNLISGVIPTGFGKLQKLQRLELGNNSLTGDIPDDLALSASLSFIDLSQNRLLSILPSRIFAIPDLQTFLAYNNNLTGQIPDQFQDCPNLSVLDLSKNQLSGNIPASLGSCEKLVKLNLMNNKLTGNIPPEIAMMSALAILDLSDNLLTGAIPENFGSSPALEMFNVSYNRLSGPVPSDGMLKTINRNDLAANAGLCGGVLPPCVSNSGNTSLKQGQRRNHIKHVVAVFLVGISIVFAVGLCFAGSRCLYKRFTNGCCDRLEEGKGEWPWRLTAFQRLNFTSNDILSCLKESNIIGMGATGVVYKAEIQRPRSVVAVKKLWKLTEENGEYKSEVELLGQLRHRNIVRLLGYLYSDISTMLVYEYMENGCLGEALHGKRAGRVLADWVSRYNVAVGIAQGLAYLHHDCFPPVIHRDVKSNNILLDSNMEARIADFGLAKMMLRKNETVSMVVGSYGYIAPEYGYTLKVDEKSDIYSYGVVLMELLTGKRPLEAEFGECVDIVEWVRQKMRSNRGVEEALDPNVGGQCKHVQEEMLLVLRIALICTAKLPRDRPSMRDVATMLGEAKPRRKSSSTAPFIPIKDKPIFTLTSEGSSLL